MMAAATVINPTAPSQFPAAVTTAASAGSPATLPRLKPWTKSPFVVPTWAAVAARIMSSC